LGIAGVEVKLIESAIEGVIISCPQIVHLGIGVEVFAGIEKVRIRCAGVAEKDAVTIVAEGIGNLFFNFSKSYKTSD
jgi:hypothetical protein